MEAHFITYEDFSSSLVLLPYIDDSAIGAKVCSHNPIITAQSDVDQLPVADTAITSQDENKSNTAAAALVAENSGEEISTVISEIVEEIVVAVEEFSSKDETEGDVQPIDEASFGVDENEADIGVSNDDQCLSCVGKEEVGSTAPESIIPEEAGSDTTIIPADYVLTKIKSSENVVEDLEHREFTELLTLLRESTYPLSLVFASPNEIAPVADSSNSDDDEEVEIEIQSSDNDVENDFAKANNPSVDEATKYAKQAASDLRGRLGRWGSVAAKAAATRATLAASAVQELRESRAKEGEKSNGSVIDDELLPQVESISDEETDSSSKESATVVTINNEDANSAIDATTPSDSQDDDENQTKKETSPRVYGKKDDLDDKGEETSGLSSLRLKQLETQLSEEKSRLEVKNAASDKLEQQKLDASLKDRKKIERETRQAKKEFESKIRQQEQTITTQTAELKNAAKALSECEAKFEEKNKTIDDLVAGNRKKVVEHEKAIKALYNELSVCQAAVEARDTKVGALTENVTKLKSKLVEQAEELAAVDSLRSDLSQSKTQSSTATQVIEKMKKEEAEFQNELKEAKGIVDDLSKKYAAAKAAVAKSSGEADKVKSDYRRLKMERNNLKTKAESLQKEMNQIAKKSRNNHVDSVAFEKIQEELEQLRSTNTKLQRSLEVERNEKKDLKAALNASRLAHQNPIINYQPTGESDGSSRIDELERIISEMTEYSSAQALQVETLRQINAALTEDIAKADSS